MNQTDVSALQKEVQQFLNTIAPDVESYSKMTWTPSDGVLPIVFRSIIIRQFEGLQVISHTVGSGIRFSVGPLLRPAYEELIWAKYLVKIPKDQAEQVVVHMARDEQFNSLDAQDKFAGRPATETLGLLPYLEASKKTKRESLEQLRELGKELCWPKQVIEGGSLPPLYWLADATNERSTYDFIYHATSRFVHFSVSELLRRAWGNPFTGTISVSSNHFGNYWAHFCLHWGISLFLHTVEALDESLDIPIGIGKADSIEVLKNIGEFRQTPIITAEELNWPT